MSSLALSWTLLPLPAADAKTPPMADVSPAPDEALVAASLGGDEDAFTGTGFPKFFMIKYHIYRNCFPLTALGRYRRLLLEIATNEK